MVAHVNNAIARVALGCADMDGLIQVGSSWLDECREQCLLQVDTVDFVGHWSGRVGVIPFSCPFAEGGMMGMQVTPAQLFYDFCLDDARLRSESRVGARQIR